MKVFSNQKVKNMHQSTDKTLQSTKGDIKLINNNNDAEEAKNRDPTQAPKIFDKIILSGDQTPVAIFIMIIILFSLVSTLLAAYFACFGKPDSEFMDVLDLIMETAFAMDIARNFLFQYTDPREPRKPVRDCARIATHYAKGAFIWDLIPQISTLIKLSVENSWTPEQVNLLFLLRLLRLSKILILMDLQKFTELVRGYYRRKLNRDINRQVSQANPGNDSAKIMQQIFLIKFFQVFRLIIFILILSYFLGALWYIMSLHTTTSDDQFTFYNVYDMKN